MRRRLTKDALRDLMKEIARSAPRGGTYRVFLLGGGTAVLEGWRESTIDVDLHADDSRVFEDVQGIKKRAGANIEFVRPEDFVPPLEGSQSRHLFIETVETVSFYHYDPYAQLLSKIVRGFDRDLRDARRLVDSGMVGVDLFRTLVDGIPEAAFAAYPTLSAAAIGEAVDEFLSDSAR